MAAITGKFIRRKKLALFTVIYFSYTGSYTHHVIMTVIAECYIFFFNLRKLLHSSFCFYFNNSGRGQSFSALSDNPVSWTVSLSPGWQSVSCPAGSLSLISILTLHLFTDLAVLPAYCCIVDNFCGWVRVSSLSLTWGDPSVTVSRGCLADPVSLEHLWGVRL